MLPLFIFFFAFCYVIIPIFFSLLLHNLFITSHQVLVNQNSVDLKKTHPLLHLNVPSNLFFFLKKFILFPIYFALSISTIPPTISRFICMSFLVPSLVLRSKKNVVAWWNITCCPLLLFSSTPSPSVFPLTFCFLLLILLLYFALFLHHLSFFLHR